MEKCRRESTPEPPMLFWRDRARGGEKGLTRGPEINNFNSRRREPVEQHRAAETILRRASFFGTHAPRDKENQPEKARRERPAGGDRTKGQSAALAGSQCT